MARTIMAIVVAIVGYGSIVWLILWENRCRRREVAEIIRRIRQRKRTIYLKQ